jgi:glutathione S-transferase
MLTLYHAPKSRSSSIVWLLEELGAPYQKHIVDIRRPDGSGSGTPDPNNPHPHGKVPALDHDGHRVFETAAIALYLTDLFPEKGLGPQVGDPLRGEYLSWLAYRPSVLEPALMMRRLNVPHVQGAMG